MLFLMRPHHILAYGKAGELARVQILLFSSTSRLAVHCWCGSNREYELVVHWLITW